MMVVMSEPEPSDDQDTTDDRPTPPGTDAVLRMAREIMGRTNEATMRLVAQQIDDTMLESVQRATSAAQRILEASGKSRNQGVIDAIWATKIMDEHNQRVASRNAALFDLIATSVRPPQIFQVAGTVEAVSGTSGSAELVGHGHLEAEGHVDVGSPETAPARQPLTREQWFALVTTLASLHSYAMDIRHGDQADRGTLLLLVAFLMIVWAMQPTDED